MSMEAYEMLNEIPNFRRDLGTSRLNEEELHQLRMYIGKLIWLSTIFVIQHIRTELKDK